MWCLWAAAVFPEIAGWVAREVVIDGLVFGSLARVESESAVETWFVDIMSSES